jgi:hypothetical protein
MLRSVKAQLTLLAADAAISTTRLFAFSLVCRLRQQLQKAVRIRCATGRRATNYVSFGSFGCAQIVCDYVIAGMNGLLWAVRISRFQAPVVS